MIKSPLTAFLCLGIFLTQTLGQQTAAPDQDPPGFQSDGCSLVPDGDIRDCCIAHDREYYFGGTSKERRASDKRLYDCVRNKKGWQHKLTAPFVWIGVRIGGVPFLPTPFRWGFGKHKRSNETPRSGAGN